MAQESEGGWSIPRPMARLNTDGDEVFPNFQSGTLLFASNGRTDGLGGFDVFQSLRADNYGSANAGPRKVNEWIKLYGDPRDSLVSVINWVEHIPYKETRNYVMRVSESLHVYRIRINGSTPSVSLTKDLK